MDRLDHGETKIVGASLAVSVAALLQLLSLDNLDIHLRNAAFLFTGSIPVLGMLFIVTCDSEFRAKAEQTPARRRLLLAIFGAAGLAVALGFMALVSHFGRGNSVTFTVFFGLSIIGYRILTR